MSMEYKTMNAAGNNSPFVCDGSHRNCCNPNCSRTVTECKTPEQVFLLQTVYIWAIDRSKPEYFIFVISELNLCFNIMIHCVMFIVMLDQEFLEGPFSFST